MDTFILILMGIGISVMLWSCLMLWRNNETGALRLSLIKIIGECEKTDIDNDLYKSKMHGRTRYETMELVDYDVMMFQFWKSFDLRNWYTEEQLTFMLNPTPKPVDPLPKVD